MFLGSARVNITVIDSNDHRPVFDQEIYHAYVPTFWKNTDGAFETVRATDIDNGINAQITYRITG